MTCGNCKWFEPVIDGETAAQMSYDDVAFCMWPYDRLPFSLRYGNRERTMVTKLDGVGCAGFEEIGAKQ